MRKYIWTIAAVALAALLGVSQLQGVQGKSDKDKLQGVWNVVTMEAAGQKVPDQFINGSTLNFVKDKVTVKFGKEKAEESTFTLDPTKSPRAIVINPPKGKEGEKALHGIYTFEGDDTLRICGAEAGDPIPKDFTSPAGSKNILFVLKRAKK